ncbi:hypothetical protein MW887_000901 [Aspergillus wentii]|nr:hypothetical protein MW887_000901 [Aspergillus wentii]
MEVDATTFDYLFHHVILPPKLPQHEEKDEWRAEEGLLQFVRDSVGKFAENLSPESRNGWQIAMNMLDNWIKVENRGEIHNDTLLRVVSALKSSGAFALRIREQSCGWLGYYDKKGNQVIFDAFEASAQCNPVLAAADTLIRSFPGQSIAIPADKIDEHQFCTYLARNLSRLSVEHVTEMAPKTRKAKANVEEPRDTVHPGLVTECLMTQLLTYGKHNTWPCFEKHIRDESNWNSSYLGWRRSPHWFVLRVSLQTVLQRVFPIHEGHQQYKNFMLYLIAEIGNTALSMDPAVPAEHLALIRTKIGRRVNKLQDNAFDFVTVDAGASTDNLLRHLQRIQTNIISSDPIPVSKFPTTAAAEDIHLSLKYSHEFLQAVINHTTVEAAPSIFSRTHNLRFKRDEYGLPLLENGDPLCLMDFEQWVGDQLSGWSKSAEPSEDLCCVLSDRLQEYLRFAQLEYGSNPREVSLMLLVILELWVAFDRMCIRVYPLLGDFTPEIPIDFLEPLLLPQRDQMERAIIVEQYLRSRHQNMQPYNPPILADPTPQSFGVRYFDRSLGHQQLRRRIEDRAEERRERKKQEWQRKIDERQSLYDQIDSSSCDYHYNRKMEYVHHGGCNRCSLSRHAAAISIDIDEWPLPSTEYILKAVVFELDCPRWFCAWRDTTWILLQDLGRGRPSNADDMKQNLLDYNQLHDVVTNHDQRLTLGSTAKSWLKTHYRTMGLPGSVQDVLFDNALQLKLFAKDPTAWVVDQTRKPSLKHHCCFVLPSGPYSQLQFTVDSVHHTQNQVIADQRKCDKEMTLHEFIAFGCLRAGERVQWHNIARELASSALSFNEESVTILLRQAAWELGSYSTAVIPLREAHRVFEIPAFGERLLETLEQKLQTIKCNWNEHWSLYALVTLALRLLTLSDGHNTSAIAAFLRNIRQVAMGWCEDLIDSLHQQTGEESKAQQHLILKLGVICQMTYFVEPVHLSAVLSTPDDLFWLIYSSMVVFENTPPTSDALPSNTKALLTTSARILHRVETVIHQMIESDPLGLNQALIKASPELVVNMPWGFGAGGNERWVTTKTRGSGGRQQTIHYNILSGEFLVDNRPPGRLPAEYTKHPLFQRVFGPRTLTVLPSGLPGAVFCSVQAFNNHQVHFSMEADQLVIIACHGTQRLRLIPHEKLQGDLPLSLVTDYVHWLDLDALQIEFRHLDQVWQPSPQNWHLIFRADSPKRSVMRKKNQSLVDIRSTLFQDLSSILAKLDSREHIHVVLRADGIVEADMVRMRLKFFINKDGVLQSRQLNATVDRNQDIGCLYGLRNNLVVKESSEPEQHAVLIPYGNVSVAPKDHHVTVSIKPANGPRTRYFLYRLDKHFNMLRGPPDMLSTLYLAYVHAVTGFVLPDPSIERSGTEEALRILRLEFLKTSFPIDAECSSMLRNLAALTPKRRYYPEHLNVMQTVRWNDNLWPMMQHDDFQPLVQEIIDHSSKFSKLHVKTDDSSPSISVADRGDWHLLQRARIRNASCRYSQFGGAAAIPKRPLQHLPRDRDTTSARSQRVYEIANLIHDWPSSMKLQGFVDGIWRWERVCTTGDQLDTLSCTKLLQLSLRDTWGALYDRCRLSNRECDSYDLMSDLSLVAFGDESKLEPLRNLLAVAFSGQLRSISIPEIVQHKVLGLYVGKEVQRYQIRSAIEQHYHAFVPDSYGSSLLSYDERVRKETIARQEYNERKYQDIASLEDEIVSQWPCQAPRYPNGSAALKVNQYALWQSCALLFEKWFHNLHFDGFLRQVQDQLIAQTHDHQPAVPVCPPQGEAFRISSPQSPTLLGWMRSSQLSIAAGSSPELLHYERECAPRSDTSGSITELRSIIKEACDSNDPHRKEYGQHLHDSVSALEKIHVSRPPTSFPVTHDRLLDCRNLLESQRDAIWDCIISALKTPGEWQNVAIHTVYPSLNKVSILSLLGSAQWSSLPKQWREILVDLGRTISSLRRCNRLISFEVKQDLHGFFKEAESISGEGWDMMEHPQWVLFELENDMTIRARQAEVAHRMINPEGNENAVLQLNMGEGKTSVITPMEAAILADGIRLLRIIVLKPLLRQSVTLLSHRLGGLQQRRIYHIPFSRSTAIDDETAAQLQSIYQECQENRGILIALPEQILSFRLVGLDLMGSKPSLARRLITLERWIQANSRTIIDESDEVLDARFQLVYTVGNQKTLDGHSDRWSIIQVVLDLVRKQAAVLRREDPSCLDLEFHGDRYPIIRFLKPETVDTLIQRIVDSIGRNGFSGVPFTQWTPGVRKSALRFINSVDVSDTDQETIRSTFEGSVSMAKLLILRGLLAQGILRFTLAGKRWMVDYGLHPTRCLMAVPFRSKGVPSENSEFGHPDVALTLACLTYYYDGLTEDQVRDCFALLEKENDPSAEYQSWIAACHDRLDEGLRAITGVNLEDSRKFSAHLYPNLRDQIPLIEFYLTRVVFPREAKEFPYKLSTSSWDIPSRQEMPVTTGFSGTNDNRSLLPLSIRQRDLPHLLHTNAMVLSHLLREENRACVLAQDQGGHQLRTDQLFALANEQSPSIRVVIDVGAQILDAGNQSVAEQWLFLTTDKKVEAAVFYDQHDEAMVIDRGGHVERLLASPFQQRMGVCLVFLDQHHSRGVDLKLPLGTRAAVTLGPRLTKDRLVQACSRLRELGNGHSVTFFIPPEVSHNMNADARNLTSKEVVSWTLKQTCDSLDTLRPLWAFQGLQHNRRAQLMEMLATDPDQAEIIVSRIQEPEARPLLQMYAPWEKTQLMDLDPDLDWSSLQTVHLLDVWKAPGRQAIARLHEEQEREIAQEVQQEQQVYRPPPTPPASHRLDAAVRHLAIHGKFPHDGSAAWIMAFESFRTTSANDIGFPGCLGPRLYATKDFVTSIQRRNGIQDDEFLKPVNWILSSIHSPNLLVLSQYEANELIPVICDSPNTRLHVYTSRTTKSMRSFRDLAFFINGVSNFDNQQFVETTRDLELFAGSLYFKSLEDHNRFRSFLGLLTDSHDDYAEGSISDEGFVNEEARKLGWPVSCPFTTSPLRFLATIFNMRGRGHGYSQTHIGSIIGGKMLMADRF